MREPFRDEVEQVMAEYKLPPLPDYDDGPGSRDLVLFSRADAPFTLTQCSLEDAQAYCSREDTHGNGWFADLDRAQEITVEGEKYAALSSGDVVCPECGATRSPERIADHMMSEHSGDDVDEDGLVL